MKYKALEDIKKGDVVAFDWRKKTVKMLRTTEDYTSIMMHAHFLNSPGDYKKNSIVEIDIGIDLSEEMKNKISSTLYKMKSRK